MASEVLAYLNPSSISFLFEDFIFDLPIKEVSFDDITPEIINKNCIKTKIPIPIALRKSKEKEEVENSQYNFSE